MTLFDAIVIGILLFSLLFGAWRGIVSEIVSLLAWVFGIFAAIQFGVIAANVLSPLIADPMICRFAAYALIFSSVLVLMAFFRIALGKVIRALGLSVSDRILGMAFGLLRGVVIVMILVIVGGMTHAPEEIWWRDAKLSRPMVILVLAAKPWLPKEIAEHIHFS